jgi:hypothetical protein
MSSSTGERNRPIGGESFFYRYAFRNNCDPFLANIRGEERFKKLMERVKYEWEHFED